MGAEEALIYLGGMGVWQMVTYCLICMFFAFPTLWQLFAIVFEGFAFHPYTCDVSDRPDGANNLDKYIPHIWSDTFNTSLPDSCSRYTYNSSYLPNETTHCTNGYDITPIYFAPKNGTITMEWNLVCENRDLVEVSQIIFTLGAVFGSLFFSPFSDMFGRKKLFFFCQLVMSLFGVAMAFSPNYVSFCIFQFLTGAFTMGNDVAGFVLGNELFPAEIRAFMAPAMYFFTAVGMMFMVVWAYFLRHWRQLQLAVSLAPLLTMLYIYHCPESVRWLIANGRYEEAKEILDEAAACNGVNPVPMEIIKEEELDQEDQGDKKPGMCQYLSHRKTFIFLAVMIYITIANNLMYYGLNLMVQALPANLYLTFFILSALELPGTLAAIVSMMFFGRRIPLACFNFFAGIFLALGAIASSLPLETYGGGQVQKDMVVTALTLTAKFGVAGGWCIELVYVQEIFPTNLRAAGVGIVAGLGAIGGVLAPIGNILVRNTSLTVPVAIFAAMALLAGCLSFLEPETLGRPLPTTIEEILRWNLTVSKEEAEVFKRKKEEFEKKKERLQRRARGLDSQAPRAQYDNKSFDNIGSTNNQGATNYPQEPPRYRSSAHVNPAYQSDKDLTLM